MMVQFVLDQKRIDVTFHVESSQAGRHRLPCAFCGDNGAAKNVVIEEIEFGGHIMDPNKEEGALIKKIINAANLHGIIVCSKEVCLRQYHSGVERAQKILPAHTPVEVAL
jgi:hypothetical protein